MAFLRSAFFARRFGRPKLARLLLPAPLVGLGAIIASAAITAAPAGCMCTDVACSDGVAITIHRADDSWDTGGYVFDVTADGKATECSFIWDGSLPPSGFPNILATCEEKGFSVSFQAKVKTTTTMDANGTSISGSPIPGKFFVEIDVAGTPESVSVAAAKDGAPLGSKTTFEPDYSTEHPNGTFCPPGCDEAAKTITVP